MESFWLHLIGETGGKKRRKKEKGVDQIKEGKYESCRELKSGKMGWNGSRSFMLIDR